MLTTSPPGTRTSPDAQPPHDRVGLRLAGGVVLGGAAAATLGVASARLLDGVLSPDAVIAVVVTEVYAAVALALLAAFRGDELRERVLGLRTPERRAFGIGAAAWVAAYAAAAVLYGAAALAGLDPSRVVDVLLGVGADGGRLHDASAGLTLLILARVCLLVPIAEELLFRGALFGWLRGRLSAPWTIAITGVLFGLMHQMPEFIPLAVLVGVAAGWVRERTGSTIVPIAMHMAQNAIFVLASLVVTGWDARLPVG